uniref:uncharacterized protein LOC122583262 n=1 Tax=Erigeron canadensis TaxID=72917 RepID=UPI001CB96F54|nr:uncharacterized protein LOC122583262 [Erigeron canadensis]
MGKITTGAPPPAPPPPAAAKPKKKGRPPNTDLKKQKQKNHNHHHHRRSTRRNPNSTTTAAVNTSGDDEEEYYDDDDDEREEKKVKLVVRLPQLDSNSGLIRSNSINSGSDSNPDHVHSGSGPPIAIQNQGEKVPKAMDTPHGSPLEAGGPTTTPLPDKKLLVFILDRLQKKDTHAVFSEPVDPEELPDYHEIIEQPMDFGTLRNKLDKGLYANLEELEADVYLICSNAMQYNPSDTVFFRQARSIQELAKRDFENLRQEGEDGELQPKVVKRGRPPSKHLKKPPGRTSSDVVAVPESTSGATVANVVENTNESTPYNLRRGPMMYKNYADSVSSHRSRNGEHSELLADWNEEFPARIKRADMKYGNKHFIIDETRRDTYKQFHPSNNVHNSLLTNFGGERKQLLAVGLHAEHGYSRSLARFAANMGPIVWKVASKKIEKALPPGVTFAPGVVGEPEASLPRTSFFSPGNQTYTPRLTSDNVLNRPEAPSTSGPKNEGSGIKANKLLPQNGRNGFSGAFGSNNSKMGMLQAHGHQLTHTSGDAQGTKGESCNTGKPSWQQVSSTNHRQFTVPVPPDLNVGIQIPSGSPGSVGPRISSIGSPQQPDLALQL